MVSFYSKGLPFFLALSMFSTQSLAFTTIRTNGAKLANHVGALGRSPRFMASTAESTEAKAPEVIVDENAYEKLTMDDVVSLCKRRGFIFPSSEIYNGMAGFYDYGPLGSELKKNVKDAWWRNFVTRREDVVGLDSSIIHNPKTWASSGKCILSEHLLSRCKRAPRKSHI